MRGRDAVAIFTFAFVGALLINYFILEPFIVPDNAMSPAYKKGDFLLVSRISHFTSTFGTGDVVIFRDPQMNGSRYIRRIIALPGQEISVNDGILKVAGGDKNIVKELPSFGNVFNSFDKIGKLDAHEYFILGDSSLEEPAGILDIRNIIGKPLMKIW